MKCKRNKLLNKLFKRNLRKKHKIFKKHRKYSLFLPVVLEETPNFSLVDNVTIYEDNMFPKPFEREKEIEKEIERMGKCLGTKEKIITIIQDNRLMKKYYEEKV